MIINMEALKQNTLSCFYKPIVLVGFMGSGKTSIGKSLSEHIKSEFIDSDRYIMSIFEKSVNEIFSVYGEYIFRIYERVALKKILEKKTPMIIATGGGTYVDSWIRQYFKKMTYSIYLCVEEKILLKRLISFEEYKKRPLLASANNIEEKIKEILSKRKVFYEKADVIINISTQTIDEIVCKIKQILVSKFSTLKHFEVSL